MRRLTFGKEKKREVKLRPGSGFEPRTLLLSGDFFLGSVIAGALTKLVLRQREVLPGDDAKLNCSTAQAMLYIASILRLGESPSLSHPADADSVDRMTACIQVGIPSCWVGQL